MCTTRFRPSENSRTKLDEIFCSAAQRKINQSNLTVAIDAPGKNFTGTEDDDFRERNRAIIGLEAEKKLITITVRDCYGKCGG
jgi:hypothetical protein